ncbi:hypothetical protein HMPREF1287_01316 [Corynebacterium sp. KPL1986]|jgi:hypothetical protein|nr:hypothetical protein HMPREF1293_02146 [Corynebacterium sp. KPL1996]ERS44809.1 hypothetical protein HMPREF1287_01316 [Corynebacterium sp. KPL1986]ERS69431.1 hypothetical protein HMPREF1300_02139 [Corynebacterium sp. KPL2004]ERS69774.1 hypothetical protein HMPREF1295_02139 [Corynebacterium sp. KPL1998]
MMYVHGGQAVLHSLADAAGLGRAFAWVTLLFKTYG